MSIFKNIMDKLLGRAKPQATSTPAAGASAAPAPTPMPPPAASAQPQTPTPAPAPGASSTQPQAVALKDVDVEAIMDDLVKESGQTLNWRTSIVDTMKALGLDSSLEHRKQLAQELHYSGDMNDSATMNIWLQKRVMQELAANGGKLPKDLTD